MTDPKEIKEAIEYLKRNLFNHNKDCLCIICFHITIKEALQTLLQTAGEYLKLKERINVEKLRGIIVSSYRPFAIFSDSEEPDSEGMELDIDILAQAIKDMLEGGWEGGKER